MRWMLRIPISQGCSRSKLNITFFQSTLLYFHLKLLIIFCCNVCKTEVAFGRRYFASIVYRQRLPYMQYNSARLGNICTSLLKKRLMSPQCFVNNSNYANIGICIVCRKNILNFLEVLEEFGNLQGFRYFPIKCRNSICDPFSCIQSCKYLFRFLTFNAFISFENCFFW